MQENVHSIPIHPLNESTVPHISSYLTFESYVKDDTRRSATERWPNFETVEAADFHKHYARRIAERYPPRQEFSEHQQAHKSRHIRSESSVKYDEPDPAMSNGLPALETLELSSRLSKPPVELPAYALQANPQPWTWPIAAAELPADLPSHSTQNDSYPLPEIITNYGQTSNDNHPPEIITDSGQTSNNAETSTIMTSRENKDTLRIAETRFEEGDFEGAYLACITVEIAHLDPSDKERFYYIYAKATYHNGEPDIAKDYCTRLIKMYSKGLDMHEVPKKYLRLMADVCEMNGDVRHAEFFRINATPTSPSQSSHISSPRVTMPVLRDHKKTKPEVAELLRPYNIHQDSDNKIIGTTAEIERAIKFAIECKAHDLQEVLFKDPLCVTMHMKFTHSSGRSFTGTALHGAALCNDTKAVEILLRHGASVHELGEHKSTPYMVAMFNGNKDVVDVLNQHKEFALMGEDLTKCCIS